MNLIITHADGSKEVHHCIVRVATSVWGDKKGLYSKKSLTVLRRESSDYNMLLDDISNIGAEEVYERLTNLHECPDGVYEVIMCDENYDRETGCVEDYNYKLIPYEKKK